MKFTIVALSVLFLTSVSASAEVTDHCWPSQGNWVDAATQSCEIKSSNNNKKEEKRHVCEHETPDKV